MSHILCHNKAAYCCCRSKHYKDCNLVLPDGIPSFTAIGRKIATNTINFIIVAVTAGLILPSAFLKSKVAPIAISPIGVDIPPILVTVLLRIAGIGILQADQIRPATIPMMIGLVTIPFNVFIHTALSIAFRSGWKRITR